MTIHINILIGGRPALLGSRPGGRRCFGLRQHMRMYVCVYKCLYLYLHLYLSLYIIYIYIYIHTHIHRERERETHTHILCCSELALLDCAVCTLCCLRVCAVRVARFGESRGLFCSSQGANLNMWQGPCWFARNLESTNTDSMNPSFDVDLMHGSTNVVTGVIVFC